MFVRSRLKSLAVFPILIAMFVMFSIVAIAQEKSLIRHIYYGRELTNQEIQNRYDAGKELHCVQQITVESLKSDNANVLYVCFDTYEEAQANVQEITPSIDYYNQVRQQRKESSKTESMSLLCDHWALYGGTGYNWWLLDLCNGGQNPNHSGVWSAWKDGSPKTLTLWSSINYGGFSYALTTSRIALTTIPFDAGGSLSSKVAP